MYKEIKVKLIDIQDLDKNKMVEINDAKYSRVPRRSILEYNSLPEKAIRTAIQEVEKIGIEDGNGVKLTDAILKLQEGFDMVADIIDSYWGKDKLQINKTKGDEDEVNR